MPLDPFSRLRRLFIYSLFIDRHSHLNIFASMWIDPRAWHRMYLQQIGDGKRDFSLETLNGYKEMFAVDPSVTAMAWEYLTERTEIDKKVLPKHLHDALATMRVYATEGNMTKLMICYADLPKMNIPGWRRERTQSICGPANTKFRIVRKPASALSGRWGAIRGFREKHFGV